MRFTTSPPELPRRPGPARALPGCSGARRRCVAKMPALAKVTRGCGGSSGAGGGAAGAASAGDARDRGAHNVKAELLAHISPGGPATKPSLTGQGPRWQPAPRRSTMQAQSAHPSAVAARAPRANNTASACECCTADCNAKRNLRIDTAATLPARRTSRSRVALGHRTLRAPVCTGIQTHFSRASPATRSTSSSASTALMPVCAVSKRQRSPPHRAPPPAGAAAGARRHHRSGATAGPL